MFARVLCLLFVAVSPVVAQLDPDWTTNHAPFRIADHLYYVGSNDLAAYLITTPEGNILINANLPSSGGQIRANIETLGFKAGDTKILLNSQAHYDHVGATAEMKRLTGAKIEVMDGDVEAMESGGKRDFFFWNDPSAQFPAAAVDHVLHDGEQVKLGGVVLVAHKTPGHTKGDTTWTMRTTDGGKQYDVVIFGGAGINPGNNVVDDPRYPTQAADFEKSFPILRGLHCDIFLGAHAGYFGMTEKLKKMEPNGPNVFVDPAGYRAYIDDREKAFRKELAREKAAKK